MWTIQQQADAGIGTTDGSDESDFSDYSVIVATFNGAKTYPLENKYFTHHATLIPVATLTGTFDAALHPTLGVDFNCGTLTTSIKNLPDEGSTVVAVIWMKDGVAKGSEGRTSVTSTICTFMPEQAAMAQVTGLSDPRITEVLKKIQAARLKGDPSTRPAATHPATRPS